MLNNHSLISSLLLETWYIDPAFAETMLPAVIELLEGKTVPHLNTQLHERPLPSLLDSDFRHLMLAVEPDGSFFGSATSGSAAVIPIRGAITKYDGYCNYGVESYMQWIEQAERSSEISNIVLLIDSPGGQANSAFMLAQRVADIKKPTLAYVDSGMAASAAYLIASAADQIHVSTPVDMLGSIGAMITLQDFSSRLEGTKTWEVYSRLSTEKNAAFRRLRENNDPSLLQDMLDENVNHFISAVKTYRGDRLQLSAGDPFKGATYTAAQALRMGLIDGISSLPEALASLKSTQKRQTIKPGSEPKLAAETPQTEQKITNNEQINTEMSLKTALINWLTDYKEETPEPAAEVPAPAAAATETPATPQAAAIPTLEERFAALEEKFKGANAQLTAENANLKTQLSAKPGAEPTAVIVANETVPAPVEAPVDTVSFYSETDEIADKLRQGIPI